LYGNVFVRLVSLAWPRETVVLSSFLLIVQHRFWLPEEQTTYSIIWYR
jgi:hypothetical protein